MREAMRIVSTRFHEPHFRVSDLARAVRLSETHLSRLVRRETGVSIRQHVVRFRMEAALTYLRSSFLSVKEIAAAVGYSSTSSFDHEFARRFGTAPKQWRNGHSQF